MPAAERHVGVGPFDVLLRARPARLLRVLRAATGSAQPPTDGIPLEVRLRAGSRSATLDHPAGRQTLDDAWHSGPLVQGVLLQGLAAWGRQAIQLHAATLMAPAGGSVLLAGPSGVGKSSASLAMGGQGWRCLGDDLAFWFLRKGWACSSDFAVALKTPAPRALARYLDGWTHIPMRFRGPNGRFASRQTYHQPPTGLPWRGPLRAVAFLARGAGRPRVRPLSAGEAVARIWPLRVEGFSDALVPEPAEVARRLDGVALAEVRTGRIADVAPTLRRWLGAEGPAA